MTETCACGAQLTLSDSSLSTMSAVARTWRASHLHAESVGICANRPEWNGPAHIPVPYCALKAGHAGAHGDGDGAHWTEIPAANPTPNGDPA